MFSEVSSSRRAEDDDDLGDSSSLSGDSDVEDDGDDDKKSSEGDDGSSSKSSHGSLHELSSLVAPLPIKKGLSKFYQGKSQSFSSFSDVRCVEDLAKKESPVSKRQLMKPSRSFAGGLDDEETNNQKNNFGLLPSGAANFNRGSTAKKAGRGSSCGSSIARTTSGCSYFASGKPPPIPMHKNL